MEIEAADWVLDAADLVGFVRGFSGGEAWVWDGGGEGRRRRRESIVKTREFWRSWTGRGGGWETMEIFGKN